LEQGIPRQGTVMIDLLWSAKFSSMKKVDEMWFGWLFNKWMPRKMTVAGLLEKQ
jgi:hypothetical protein